MTRTDRLNLLLLFLFALACLGACRPPPAGNLTNVEVLAESATHFGKLMANAEEQLAILEKIDTNILILVLNGPSAGYLKTEYPMQLSIYGNRTEMIDNAYTGGELAYYAEEFAISRWNKKSSFVSLTDEEWLDQLKKTSAFRLLAVKDISIALSWLRKSAGKNPTIQEALYVGVIGEVLGTESGLNLEEVRSSWTALLSEENLILFTAGLGRTDDFASDEEFLRSFERATAAKWPGLHRTAIEMLRVRSRTRESTGGGVALKNYLKKLGDAPFSEERKDFLRKDVTKLLEELKTPKQIQENN